MSQTIDHRPRVEQHSETLQVSWPGLPRGPQPNELAEIQRRHAAGEPLPSTSAEPGWSSLVGANLTGVVNKGQGGVPVVRPLDRMANPRAVLRAAIDRQHQIADRLDASVKARDDAEAAAREAAEAVEEHGTHTRSVWSRWAEHRSGPKPIDAGIRHQELVAIATAAEQRAEIAQAEHAAAEREAAAEIVAANAAAAAAARAVLLTEADALAAALRQHRLAAAGLQAALRGIQDHFVSRKDGAAAGEIERLIGGTAAERQQDEAGLYAVCVGVAARFRMYCSRLLRDPNATAA